MSSVKNNLAYLKLLNSKCRPSKISFVNKINKAVPFSILEHLTNHFQFPLDFRDLPYLFCE